MKEAVASAAAFFLLRKQYRQSWGWGMATIRYKMGHFAEYKGFSHQINPAMSSQ
jgi:hypothetical protein